MMSLTGPVYRPNGEPAGYETTVHCNSVCVMSWPHGGFRQTESASTIQDVHALLSRHGESWKAKVIGTDDATWKGTGNAVELTAQEFATRYPLA